jgi:hypothetical protein
MTQMHDGKRDSCVHRAEVMLKIAALVHFMSLSSLEAFSTIHGLNKTWIRTRRQLRKEVYVSELTPTASWRKLNNEVKLFRRSAFSAASVVSTKLCASNTRWHHSDINKPSSTTPDNVMKQLFVASMSSVECLPKVEGRGSRSADRHQIQTHTKSKVEEHVIRSKNVTAGQSDHNTGVQSAATLNFNISILCLYPLDVICRHLNGTDIKSWHGNMP